MEYRERSSGDLISKTEAKKRNPNVSLPKVWNDSVLEVLGIDPVFQTPKPSTTGSYKIIVRNGVEQDAAENWVQSWLEKDMFSNTDEATKTEQETEYQATLDAAAAKSVRYDRDEQLAKTDWLGLSDVTMSTEWAAYRQGLRDVPSQEGFPYNVTWPEKP